MGMTKTNVEDRTIRAVSEERMVGDVTKISTSDTAKAGSKDSTGTVAAPNYMANPGVSDGKAKNDYIPSTEGDANRAADQIPGQAPNMPDDYAAPGGPDEESSVNSGPYGQRVNFPAAADMTSADIVKSMDTLVQQTGSKISFPVAADQISAGGCKDVKSFVPSGADWK